MLLGATISSVSDPTYLSTGLKNSTPLYLRFELQDSSIVAKVPNSNYFKHGLTEREKDVLALNYRDPSFQSFKIECYTPDSTRCAHRRYFARGTCKSLAQRGTCEVGQLHHPCYSKFGLDLRQATQSF